MAGPKRHIRGIVRTVAARAINAGMYTTDWKEHVRRGSPVVRLLGASWMLFDSISVLRPIIDLRRDELARTDLFAKGVRIIRGAPPTNTSGGYVDRVALVATLMEDGTGHMSLMACTVDDDLIYYEPCGFRDVDLDSVIRTVGMRGQALNFGDEKGAVPSLQGYAKSGCCALVTLAVSAIMMACSDRAELLRLLSDLHNAREINRTFMPYLAWFAGVIGDKLAA